MNATDLALTTALRAPSCHIAVLWFALAMLGAATAPGSRAAIQASI
jgi:hypothetical protein